MGTINYSGEFMGRQWDNREVDYRGVLGACECFTHVWDTKTIVQMMGEHDRQKSKFSHIRYMGPIYMCEWTSV